MERPKPPVEFKPSYANLLTYPQTLPAQEAKTDRFTLETYRTKLDAVEKQLCLVEEDDINVPIRDLYGSAETDIKKCNIHTEDQLNSWLGIGVCPKGENTCAGTEKAFADIPKSRFIYIYAEHSRDQLRLTRRMLVTILTHYRVMPGFLNFLFVFGTQSGPRDLRFSSFITQTAIAGPQNSSVIPRYSERQFQLCYNLKGVSKKNEPEDIMLCEWSIRQAAMHHQFDVVYGTTLWIVAKGRLDIQQRYKNLTSCNGHPEDKLFGTVPECFRSTLAVHLMLCHWATEDWHGYIQWLEDVVNVKTSIAIYGRRDRGRINRQYKSQDIQELHHWKDKAAEVVLMLESNVKVITALRGYYRQLITNRHFPLRRCKKDIDLFTTCLYEIAGGLKMQTSRAKFLVGIIIDRKELILQHLQSQASERTEQLNQHLEKDAILMRIITIVTLFYLPATFVSTFFSTDIINYQNQSGEEPGPGTFSSAAMTRWLQVVIPLTLLTISFAWLGYKGAERARRQSEQYPEKTRYCGPKLSQMNTWPRSWTLGRRKSSRLPTHKQQIETP